MQKKKFLLLLALAWLLCGWALHAQNTNNCNLPAPTNIQFSQSSSTTLNVTWNAVPGAIGYVAALENLSNSNQPIQTVITVPPAYNGFTVIPGNLYRFRVAARCANLRVSPNYGERSYKADYIVVEVIADRGSCPQGAHVATLTGYGVCSLPPSSNLYYAVLSNSLLPDSPQYQFKYENDQFYFKGVGSAYSGEVLAGLAEVPPNNCPPPCFLPPPVVASAIKATYSTSDGPREIGISFASPKTLYFKGPNDFVLTIYQSSCPGGFSPGSNEGDDPITPTIDPVAQAALRNIQVVNPFASDLTLLFSEHPEQPVTAQLCDLSGRTHLQKTIQPGEVGTNQYVLATAELPPGMYFLRLETAPGVFSTHKVVKYDQR